MWVYLGKEATTITGKCDIILSGNLVKVENIMNLTGCKHYKIRKFQGNIFDENRCKSLSKILANWIQPDPPSSSWTLNEWAPFDVSYPQKVGLIISSKQENTLKQNPETRSWNKCISCQATENPLPGQSDCWSPVRLGSLGAQGLAGV